MIQTVADTIVRANNCHFVSEIMSATVYSILLVCCNQESFSKLLSIILIVDLYLLFEI